MTSIKANCPRLDEVRQCLTTGHWPHAAAPELRGHPESCVRCAQEILLTSHFQQARSESIALAQPVTPGPIWWRAQLRRRNAALARVGRPIAAAQIFALTVVVVAIGAMIAMHWRDLLARTFSAQTAAATLTALGSQMGLAPLLLAITLIATLGGIVLYLSADS